MATKEKLKTKAARVREEARETGKVILRAPALVRAAECVIRFLLGAMLSGAEIFGGYAPFGLGLVPATGSGLDGFCAARWQNRDRWPMAETVSKASFCIYLTHLFFLDFLAGTALSAATLPPVWGVPELVAAAFGGGFLVWLVLRRVPVVKTYLI